MPQSFLHDPNSDLDYSIDWSAWLAAGDTISTSTWAAETGISIMSISNTTTTATVWLSGGTVGTTQSVTNHIVTSAGREDDRTLLLLVGHR